MINYRLKNQKSPFQKSMAKFLLMIGFIFQAIQYFEPNVGNAALGTIKKEKVSIKELIEHFNDNAKLFDPLSLRIAVKKMAKNPLPYKTWYEIRRYLMFNPQVGYDMIYKWERIRPQDPKVTEKEININESFEKADQLSLNEKFNDAFKIYQSIALFLKGEIKKGKSDNLFLYSVALQSMGRTLFGARRFNEALEVYNWIPKNFPRFKQILFEKMWTGFRAGRIDVALGAIASQESSYFSNYQEPETYLLKVYIFKKLCRDEDLKDLRMTLNSIKSRIEKKDPKFYREWAKSDIEIMSLSNLVTFKSSSNLSPDISSEDRENEKNAIRSILKKRYEIDLLRYKRDLEAAIAYSNIALGTKDFNFVKHEEINHEELMAKGDEVWAVNDAEDWVDEIGGHLFIGDSLCGKAASPLVK